MTENLLNMRLLKRCFAVFLVTAVIVAYAQKCGICPVSNRVAVCTDLIGYSCLRIPNGDVRDVFVGRCGQKIIPSILQTLASFGGKRCHASKYFSVVCLKNLYFSREYIFILYKQREYIYTYICIYIQLILKG